MKQKKMGTGLYLLLWMCWLVEGDLIESPQRPLLLLALLAAACLVLLLHQHIVSAVCLPEARHRKDHVSCDLLSKEALDMCH